MKTFILNLFATVILLSLVSNAQAIPTLQIYMEGATYDQGSETWTLSTAGTFKLWVLGQGGVYDVKLAAAYATEETGSISLTSTTATASYLPLNGQDTTLSAIPVSNGLHADGTIPKMGSGADLPTHGTYGAGTSWAEWLLGDFLATTDKVADMTASPLNWKAGQLNAYDVTVTGYSSIHFDAYDHTVNTNGRYRVNNYNYVKAPFSHDAEANPVPEPGTILLLGAGLIGLAIFGKRRMK